MRSDRQPELSVILVTPDRYAPLRETVGCLLRQTVRDALEIVLVAPAEDALELDPSELDPFLCHHVVEVGPLTTTGAAMAAGVRRATAPVVAYAEEHSYPEPAWAEAVIRRHREPWAAVGWPLRNANPGSLIAWASLLTDFASWVAPVEGGEVSRLPGHHAAYKRDVLLAYGDRLAAMLEVEGVLHFDMRRNGLRLYLEPSVSSLHVNVSRLGSYFQAEYLGGRTFAAARARSGRWSPLKRILFVAGAPLIPLVRLRRILADVRRAGLTRQVMPRTLPALCFGVTAHTVGEIAGYTLGSGRAQQRRIGIELQRRRHLGRRERE